MKPLKPCGNSTYHQQQRVELPRFPSRYIYVLNDSDKKKCQTFP